MAKRGLTVAQLQEICKSPEVQAKMVELAEGMAASLTEQADAIPRSRYDDPPKYGSNIVVHNDTARAHVWTANGSAIHAERKSGLMLKEIAARGGSK